MCIHEKYACMCMLVTFIMKSTKVLNPRQCIMHEIRMRIHEKYACSTDTQLPASRKQ